MFYFLKNFSKDFVIGQAIVNFYPVSPSHYFILFIIPQRMPDEETLQIKQNEGI